MTSCYARAFFRLPAPFAADTLGLGRGRCGHNVRCHRQRAFRLGGFRFSYLATASLTLCHCRSPFRESMVVAKCAPIPIWHCLRRRCASGARSRLSFWAAMPRRRSRLTGWSVMVQPVWQTRQQASPPLPHPASRRLPDREDRYRQAVSRTWRRGWRASRRWSKHADRRGTTVHRSAPRWFRSRRCRPAALLRRPQARKDAGTSQSCALCALSPQVSFRPGLRFKSQMLS